MRILESTNRQALERLLVLLNQNANIKEGNTTITLCNIEKHTTEDIWFIDLGGALENSNGGGVANAALAATCKENNPGIVQEFEKSYDNLINEGYVEEE